MEKNTKILIGIGAAIAAYLILKPKKAVVAQTIVNKEPSKKIDVDSLERVPSPDDTPEMSIGSTRRTYKDKDGVIYKYIWGSAYPPHGTYTDTNGNKWDDNGNPIIVNNIQTNEDEYICPSGYKLTPRPMGFSSMEVCEDENGKSAPFTNGKKFKSDGINYWEKR
jgi:hypothetical protein